MVDTLRILHLEDDFVAVSKPGGLLVHRDEHHPDAPAALQIVRDQLERKIYPFHRLDRPTSGILLFGFSSAAAAALQFALSDESATKEYLALMRWPGSLEEHGDEWVCDQVLHTEDDRPKAAHSEFTRLETFRGSALVRCRITTGRYHQIRRHANHCGRHVLGDTTHGKGRINALFREKYGLPRLFLHLQRVEMAHPSGNGRLEILDPLPAELESVLERLREEVTSCRPSPS
ncbi:MAG: pseudouridine synthase [bacterium]|nr:pseudouridine synthase [bacterium]